MIQREKDQQLCITSCQKGRKSDEFIKVKKQRDGEQQLNQKLKKRNHEQRKKASKRKNLIFELKIDNIEQIKLIQ